MSQNQQEFMAVKTHWDCESALSFALEGPEGGGGVNGRDGATGAARRTIAVDSRLLTRDSSESIEA